MIAKTTPTIWPGLAWPSLMSVVPKLNARCRLVGISEDVGGQATELTEGIDSVNSKKETGQTNALCDCKSAIRIVGLLHGDIIQGCKHML
jgi:hypothetical protein